MSVRLLRMFTVSSLMVSILGGCDSRSAVERRADEFRYSSDSLATELIDRLAALNSRNEKRKAAQDKRGADIRELEADRGGDGDRPDPNSMEAIVADAVAKVRNVEAGGETDVAENLIQRIETADQLPAELISEFKKQFQAAIGQNDG